jgi:hypothetical protein
MKVKAVAGTSVVKERGKVSSGREWRMSGTPLKTSEDAGRYRNACGELSPSSAPPVAGSRDKVRRHGPINIADGWFIDVFLRPNLSGWSGSAEAKKSGPHMWISWVDRLSITYQRSVREGRSGS